MVVMVEEGFEVEEEISPDSVPLKLEAPIDTLFNGLEAPLDGSMVALVEVPLYSLRELPVTPVFTVPSALEDVAGTAEVLKAVTSHGTVTGILTVLEFSEIVTVVTKSLLFAHSEPVGYG